MTAFAYRFRGRSGEWSKKIVGGALANHISGRIDDHTGPFALSRVGADGKRHDTGPERDKKQAPEAFGGRIIHESMLDKTWRIDTPREPWFLDIKAVDWPTGERVIAAARSQLGVHYVWGAANGPNDPGEDAFDCSGLTQWAWGTVGVYLPHQSQLQREAVPKVNDPRPADLVFFDFEPPYHGVATHVGLWVRPGWVIDTRNPTDEPVAYRPIDGDPYLLGFGRPG